MLYRVGNKLARRGNNLLAGGDPGCCCGIDCGCGCSDFVCCNPSASFFVTHDPDCGTGQNPPIVTAQWRWVGCQWTFAIGGPYSSIEGLFTYPANSGCNAPVGVWTAGTYGNDREFNTPPNVASRRCIVDGATVVIARTALGYSFAVSGVVVDPDWDCVEACSQINSTWVVEC